LEILRDEGSQKPKFLKEIRKLNQNFLRGVGGGGTQTEKLSLAGM